VVGAAARGRPCRSAGLDDVAHGFGVSDAGGGGATADELPAWRPHGNGNMLVAVAVWIVGDEGDLADVDGEQVELSWLRVCPIPRGSQRLVMQLAPDRRSRVA